jgi:uncharacterized protein YcbX
MLIEVDGLDPHAEDAWVGAVVRIGAAAVRFHGHVGRCLVTSRDPENGEIDLPALDLLRGYQAVAGTGAAASATCGSSGAGSATGSSPRRRSPWAIT